MRRKGGDNNSRANIKGERLSSELGQYPKEEKINILNFCEKESYNGSPFLCSRNAFLLY